MGRKFFIAISSEAIAAIALFADKISGSEWVMVTTALLGIYGYHNVKGKK